MDGFASGGSVKKLRCGGGEGGVHSCSAERARQLARMSGDSGDSRIEKTSEGIQRLDRHARLPGSHHSEHQEMTAGHPYLHKGLQCSTDSASGARVQHKHTSKLTN